MRFINRYKNYDKLFSIFEKFPLRVLKFKSTKWKRIQRLLSFKCSKVNTRSINLRITKYNNKIKPTRKKLFFDNLLVKVSLRTWYRVEKYYENGRRIKNVIHNIFDKSVLTSHFRKVLKQP